MRQPMIEENKVYVEPVEVNSQVRTARYWKVLYRVSDEVCFCVEVDSGRHEIKNPSKWKPKHNQ